MKNFLAPALFLACGAISTPVTAATQVYTYNYPISSNSHDWGTDGVLPSDLPQLSHAFPLFDPALGTLTDVTFEANFRFEFYVYTGSTGGGMSVGVSGYPAVNGLAIGPQFATGASLGGGPNTGHSLSQLATSTQSFNSGILGDFIGTGTATWSWNPPASYTSLVYYVGALGSGGYAAAKLESGEVKTTYSFNSIPEPATVAVWIGGVALLGTVLARRRQGR